MAAARRNLLRTLPLVLAALVPAVAGADIPLDVRSRGEISAAIGREQPGYAVREASTGAFVGHNAAHAFRARFGADGVRFDAGWGLALASWRCGPHVVPAQAVRPSSRDNRIEYHRGALREWYVNGPFGLQHGLTYEALPGTCREHPLVVRYRVLDPPRRLRETSAGIDVGGLRYGGLYVYDADDRSVAARMSYDVESSTLELAVDVGNARTPIVIDPFVESTRLPSGDPAAGFYGTRVAVSGDTVLVGAPGSDPGGVTDRGLAFVFIRTAQGWARQAVLSASDGSAGDNFGLGASLSQDVAVVGALFDDGPGGADQGAAYVFERVDGSWVERQKLTAADGAADDQFGIGLSATLAGSLIAVGAYGADVGASLNQGKVYLFAKNGTTWTPVETLTAPDGAAFDGFGLTVALSGDTLVVGSYAADVGANADQGAAYVFTGDASDFAFQQKLVATGGAAGDLFGESVAVSGDFAVVGATSDDLPGGVNQGSAYAFARSGGVWTQQQQLAFPSAQPGDAAGFTTAVSQDVIAIGGFRRDTGGIDAGQIATFRRIQGAWQFEQAIIPSDAQAGNAFGASLALEGGRIAVGASLAAGGGAAYVFEEPSPLADSGAEDSADPAGATDDQTGTAVATALDLMAVGAPEVDGKGIVYLYQLKGTTDPTAGCGTNLDSVLVATMTNVAGGIGDKFGAAVTMSSDASTIVVGAPQFNATGRAAVFRRPPGGWNGTIDIAAADTIAPPLLTGDKFGSAVSIADNGTIAVGVPGNDSQGGNAGAVMTFNPVSNAYDDVAEGMVVAMTPQAGAAFGSALQLQAGQLIVGAPLEDNVAPGNVNIPDSGAAYAYTVSPTGTATPLGAMEPTLGGGIGDKFGSSVGVSFGTMVIGAPGTDTAAGGDSGAAFVFESSGGPPTLAGMLVPPEGAGQQAGSAVGIAGDYVMLGAPFADPDGMAGEGASYLYEEPESGWSSGPAPLLAAHRAEKRAAGMAAFLPNTRVSPIKRQPDQAFGSAIGLTRRGLAVGAPLRDDDIPNCSSDIVDEGGADAYLFDRVLRDGFE